MKKYKILVIIFCFISCFILGIVTAEKINTAKNNKYTLDSKFENIKLNKSENINEDNYLLYKEDLIKVPKSLIQYCNNIYFTNENLNEKFNLDIKTKVVAISYGNDIYIDTKYYGNDVVTHEMFHVFDYGNNWISDSEEFITLYEKYKDVLQISPGNDDNNYEFFATCGEKYISHSLIQPELNTFFNNLNIQP